MRYASCYIRLTPPLGRDNRKFLARVGPAGCAQFVRMVRIPIPSGIELREEYRAPNWSRKLPQPLKIPTIVAFRPNLEAIAAINKERNIVGIFVG